MHFQVICHNIINNIREAIDSEEFLKQFKEPKRFVRNRLLSMKQVIIYLFYTNKAAYGINIGNIRLHIPRLRFPEISRQAVSKARQFIKPGLFKKIFDITVKAYYRFTKIFALWNHYHLFAIDGSQIHMPFSPSVEEAFGWQGDPRYDKKHYMGLASILYDVSQDYVVDACIGKHNSSERTFAQGHISRLCELGLLEHSLILFDRGYFSVQMFNALTDAGCSCLMRIREDIRSLTESGKEDNILSSSRYNCAIRVIRTALDTGETEYLVTNILDPALSPEMFRDLYHRRWEIETKYYELKEHWGLESFSGITSCSIEQEFFITLTKSNFCSIIKAEADRQIQQSAAPSHLHTYQSRRTHLIGRIQVLFPYYLTGQDTFVTFLDLLKEGIRSKSMIQPGRHDKRKMPKTHRVRTKNRKPTM